GNYAGTENITITGGMVTASSAGQGAGIGGGRSGSSSSIKITGGSVNASGNDGSRAIDSPTNADGKTKVYLTTLILKESSDATSGTPNLSVSGLGITTGEGDSAKPYPYRTRDMKTDSVNTDKGKLYIWLPEGAVTHTAAGGDHLYVNNHPNIKTNIYNNAAYMLTIDDHLAPALTIAGTPEVGMTLTANFNASVLSDVIYYWYWDDGLDDLTGDATKAAQLFIAKSTDSNEYTLQPSDIGHRIVAVITSKYNGNNFSLTSDATEIVRIPDPIDYAKETFVYDKDYIMYSKREINADCVIKSDTTLSEYTDDTAYIRLNDVSSPEMSDYWQEVRIPPRPEPPSGIEGHMNIITGVDSTMEYKLDTSIGWTSCPENTITELAAGSYDVRYKANETKKEFASESTKVTVVNLDINFIDESISYEDTIYSVYPSETSNEVIDEKKGSISNYTGSYVYYTIRQGTARYRLAIPPRPDAPTGIAGGVNEITGVNETMQYKLASATEWTDCKSAPVSAAAGEYLVRYKATAAKFASETARILVVDPLSASVDYMAETITYNARDYTFYTSQIGVVSIVSAGSITDHIGGTIYYVRNDELYRTA
ncbi:MAG: hypothetical protein Q4D04_06315, partial [Clostridia bacterium]|nr:hypothetical protein [Clostridia bacterium]